jgi:ubiquitin-protein ligase
MRSVVVVLVVFGEKNISNGCSYIMCSFLNPIPPPTLSLCFLCVHLLHHIFLFLSCDSHFAPYTYIYIELFLSLSLSLQGGFFIFDMMLPINYPQTSPEVLLITTGSGQVRFNPNLYNCGKVCLSLLGTWEGERWDAQHSNINQVIQSICYLIFVENPYFNEPGFESRQGTKEGDTQSNLYTAAIRSYTIKYALLEHLISPDVEFGATIKEAAKSAWKDLKIKALFTKWAEEETGAKRKEEMVENIQRIDAIFNDSK